jgi:molecular chaperone DnaK
MPKLTMLKQPVRKYQEHEEDRGEKAPVLLAGRGKGFLGRLGSAGRGYALAGAGVVAAAVVAVSLLSWLAPDSDRPIASPLEAVGRVAGGVIEQVDDQVEALLGTDDGENTVLRSVREGLVAASSASPWPSGNLVGNASSPSSSTASPDSASSSTDDAAAAPSRGGESSSASDGTPPSQAASSTPSSPSEAPTSTEDTPSPPPASEPAPPASEEPPVAEEPSTPPPSAEPPPVTEEPPPATEEPPPPVEGPPETSADE